jgi:putative redox protein
VGAALRNAVAADCEQLAADGIGMLRFDNLGLGDSEGTGSAT